MVSLHEVIIFLVSLEICFFFFSSRRRHTRCLSDWSSDVCSSDLNSATVSLFSMTCQVQAREQQGPTPRAVDTTFGSTAYVRVGRLDTQSLAPRRPQIGRASCRERV